MWGNYIENLRRATRPTLASRDSPFKLQLFPNGVNATLFNFEATLGGISRYSCRRSATVFYLHPGFYNGFSESGLINT